MATKPNETYKWGENATHEQVAEYEDTGWPSDISPPKRTQFNWYQNLVGKWLGWIEETVLDAWFIEIQDVPSPLAGVIDLANNIPHVNGFYEASSFVASAQGNATLKAVVFGDTMHAVTFGVGLSYTLRYYQFDWDGTEWTYRVQFVPSSGAQARSGTGGTTYMTPAVTRTAVAWNGVQDSGDNAFNGGWVEWGAGPDYFILQEWGEVTLDANGFAAVTARFFEEYEYQGVGVVSVTRYSGFAGIVVSGAMSSGVVSLSGVLLDGSPADGATVNWSYTIRLPR